MIRVVAVHFEKSTNLYNYKTDLDLKKEDIVIVESTNSIGIAKVYDDNVTSIKGIKIATKFVLMKIDINAARKRIKSL